MHTSRHLRRAALLCLAAAALAGCGSRQDSYTPDQQKQMKSGQPPQVTADQQKQMEAALRAHMGSPPSAPARR